MGGKYPISCYAAHNQRMIKVIHAKYWRRDMRTIAMGGALLALGACLAPEGESSIADKRPSELSAEERRVLPLTLGAPLCTVYNTGRARTGAFDDSDYRILEQALSERLTARDLELLRSRNEDFGTDQSWHGLRCSVPGTRIVNRSFYPGIGHTWQARTPGGQFIYLRGDGTTDNMRVHSWN